MRDARLADINTRMLLKLYEQLTDAMRLVAWDLAKCTPDAPDVSWGQHQATLEKLEIAVKIAEQNVVYHQRKKKPKDEAIQATR